MFIINALLPKLEEVVKSMQKKLLKTRTKMSIDLQFWKERERKKSTVTQNGNTNWGQ